MYVTGVAALHTTGQGPCKCQSRSELLLGAREMCLVSWEGDGEMGEYVEVPRVASGRLGRLL